MNRIAHFAILSTIVILASAAQSVELAMQLPLGKGNDAAYGELESGAMDRFFDAGLVLTTGTESEALDVVDLCAHAHEAYIDWVLVFDMAGAAPGSSTGQAESVTWSLYRAGDAALSGSASVALPATALKLSDRMDRLRALGDAAAASVLTQFRSGGLSAPGTDSILGSSGG